MGSRTDVYEILSSARWSEEGSYLGELAKSGKFPCIVKVIRGQYQNIGQPSFSNPSLVSYLLLLSAGKQISVAAQCVKFKNCRQRVIPFGPTLAIPSTFSGHFEILNEDGKSIPCLSTVASLAKRFPHSFLVHEAIKVNKPCDSSKGSPPCSEINENLPHSKIYYDLKISDKTRIIQPGEILVLCGEVQVPSGKKISRYLRCFDAKGQTVYLNAAQKGKFSPVARDEEEDNISGVHTTKSIINKRMPLMVRLVNGLSPVTSSYKNSSFIFKKELRLFNLIQEEQIFALPLSQSSSKELSNSVYCLPLSVPLKFQVCKNMEEIEQMKEFCRLNERAKNLADHSRNLIQIYDVNLKKELRFDGRQWKAYAPPIFLSPHSDSNVEIIPDVSDYEDIDQIYDYVRGIKPPPTRIISSDDYNSLTDYKKVSKRGKSSPPPSKSNLKGKDKEEENVKNGTANNKLVRPPAPAKTKSKMRGAVSMDRLISSTLAEDEALPTLPISFDKPPLPPPIETIPTNKNKAHLNNNNSSSGNGNGLSLTNININSNESCANLNSNSNNNNSNSNNKGKVSSKIWLNNKKNSAIHHNHNNSKQIHTNLSGSSSGGSGGGGERKARLFIKHNSSPIGPIETNGGNGNGISGSPTNRLVFRRSPIFDCRYKSMNDLNRNSLESGGSSSSSQHQPKMRYFHHNHHNHPNGYNISVNSSSNNLLNIKVTNSRSKNSGGGGGGGGRIFRPKSLTNIISYESGKKLDLVVPSHVHAIHTPPPPSIELFQKIPRNSQRGNRQQPTLYL